MNILFLDVETTGTEEKDRLCQLAYKLKGYEGCEYLFKPEVPMTVGAMSVCHITDKMLEDKPMFKSSLLYPTLKTLFKDPQTVFVAHNAEFDMGFLEREGLRLPERFICTMKVAHHHDTKGELEKHNLQFLRYTYGLEFEEEINPHDALSDVLVLEKLFDYYNNHYTVDQMVEISSRPILFKKMMFGKYKGKLFADIAKIDTDYFKWLLRETKVDANMRHTLEYYLKGKSRLMEFSQ